MAKYVPSAELKERLAEPIEFELKGREFRIDCVSTELQRRMERIEDAEDPIRSLLGALIGEEALDELGEIDLREAKPLLDWLREQIMGGLGDAEKNLDGGSDASPSLSLDSSATENC